jgi:hypothetical protein
VKQFEHRDCPYLINTYIALRASEHLWEAQGKVNGKLSPECLQLVEMAMRLQFGS